MFPEYYDQFTPYLERLLCKLNKNVTVDFFDADYGRNKKLVDATASVCNKVAVVNEHLYQYFKKLNSNVCFNDLVVDINEYEIKKDYSLKKIINIFWTGSEANSINLKEIIPVLEKINQKHPLQLRMISRTTCGYSSAIISHSQWNKQTFFSELINADIAIYPAMKDTEFTKGKVAYKSIEYSAAALPIIASPFGLSPHLENEKDVLIANNIEEWGNQLIRLINDESLRRKIGVNARMKAEEYHSVNSTYKKFLGILLEVNRRPINRL